MVKSITLLIPIGTQVLTIGTQVITVGTQDLTVGAQSTPACIMNFAGLDPGFSVGGHGPIWGGGFGLQRGHFSVKMYAKMKELGPVGGHVPAHLPRRSAYALCELRCMNLSDSHTWLIVK